MPADESKSLIVQLMAPGHSLPEAECRAAAIVSGCCGIAGYRFRDAERLPACRPETRPAIVTGPCGTVSESVDRDRIFLPDQPGPAPPDNARTYYGIAEPRRISSAAPGIAVRVPW